MYTAYQEEARRLRQRRVSRLAEPSTALLPGGVQGWRVDGGLQPGPLRDGQVTVLFDRHPNIIGWPASREGRPGEELLSRVRHFSKRK